jgi:sigma-B regulation protein RsbU (phosphoserine phosphatase)
MNERLLIVEDTPANIEAITGILKDRGYQLSVATSGEQALDLVQRVKPDLILLDVMMPGMDGYEACRRLKSLPEWRDTPVIFLTAKAETADIVRGFEVGAVDYVAKPFNAHELLARIQTHLTVDHLRRSLAEKNEALARAHQRELEMAFKVQSQLIPDRLPEVPGWEFAARWQPAKEVSGDYYDFIPSRGRLGIVVADVSGKGMYAALFMASTRSIIRAKAMAELAPARMLSEANVLLCADAAQGMFVTLFYADIDPATSRLSYVGCGHCPPFWYRANLGTIAEIEPTGSVLGIDETMVCRAEEISVGRGDVLVFYTDGFTEAFDEQRRLFGEERMKGILARHAGDPPSRILEEIEREIAAFAGSAPPSDDRTIVIARRG